MGVLKVDDLHPDGIRIVVDWATMSVGSSVFVPCINTQAASKQIKSVFAESGWEHQIKVTIEDGKLGVRVWRML